MCPKRFRKQQPSTADPGLDYLLTLNGVVRFLGRTGYWIKIEVSRVEATPARPYGIKYSLTLHDDDGRCVIGFDNAHGGALPAGASSKHLGKPRPFDHRHRHSGDKGIYYEFKNGFKLLEDFYGEISRVFEEMQP